MKSIVEQLNYLSILEVLIVLGSFLFSSINFYINQNFVNSTQIGLPVQTPLLILIIGFVVLILFFIGVVMKVRSISHFSAVCILTLVQLWLTYRFLSVGVDIDLAYSFLFTTVYFLLLSAVHFYIAHKIMKNLERREFII